MYDYLVGLSNGPRRYGSLSVDVTITVMAETAEEAKIKAAKELTEKQDFFMPSTADAVSITVDDVVIIPTL